MTSRTLDVEALRASSRSIGSSDESSLFSSPISSPLRRSPSDLDRSIMGDVTNRLRSLSAPSPCRVHKSTSVDATGPCRGCRIPLLSIGIVITLCVLCSGGAMLLTLEGVVGRLQEISATSLENISQTQGDLIHELILDNISSFAFAKVLESVRNMYEQGMKDPTDRAVDTLTAFLQYEHDFNPVRTLTLSDDYLFNRVPNQMWITLRHIWSSQCVTPQCISTSYLTWDPRSGDQFGFVPSALYVALSEKFVGFSRDPHDASHCYIMESTNASSVNIRPISSTVGGAVGERTELLQRFSATEQPFYRTQARLADAARKGYEDTGDQTRLVQAWSGLSHNFFGKVIMSFTSPVAFCGNYSCMVGVIAADFPLEYMHESIVSLWEDLRSVLAFDPYNFQIGPKNSTIFVVVQESDQAPEQVGILTSCSSELGMQNPGSMVMAVDAPDQLAREVARLMKAHFKEWNAPELMSQQLFSLWLPGAEMQPIVALPCNPLYEAIVNPGIFLGCMNVGTLSVEFDSHTRWLVVVALPADSFGASSFRTLAQIREQVKMVAVLSKNHVNFARVLGYIILVVIAVLSVCVVCWMGRIVSTPLNAMAKLMGRLGELDFANDTSEFSDVLDARSWCCAKEVVQLQVAFCRLSRAIEAFARFVPETVVRNIVRGDERATRLHVSQREVTIMFSDIKDFTHLSEMLTQRDLLFVLTRYFSVMTRIIEHYDGAVCEILGDGILAFWNTPDDVDNHAAKACASALAQQQALTVLNAEFHTLDLPEIGLRIGLNTGTVLTGNIGSERKMKFGSMGDPVNLASRLEGLCKFYNVAIICSAQTHAKLGTSDGICCRRLDLVQVKGREEPTLIFEVVGRTVVPDSGELVGSVSRRSNVTDTEMVVRDAIESSRVSLKLSHNVIFGPIIRLVQQRRSARRHGTFCFPGGTATPAAESPQRRSAISTWLDELDAKELPSAWVEQPLSSERILTAHLYEEALIAYQNAQFTQARDLVTQLLQSCPDDVPAVRLRERALDCLADDGQTVKLTSAELARWTGVVQMSDK